MRDVSLVGIASAIKTGWVFLLFAVAARVLDPVGFSEFSFWLTIAFILNLFFDYGQQTGLLTKFSSKPRLIKNYLRRALGLKYAMAAAVTLLGLVFLLLELLDPRACYFLFASCMGALAASIGIAYLIIHRSQENYWPDLLVGVTETVVAAAGCLAIVSFDLHYDLAFIFAFALARIAGCIAVLLRTSDCRGALLKPKIPERKVFKQWWPYFSHMTAGTLVVNLDLIITKFILSPVEYSLYQAGMRTVQAANIAFTAVNNVFIPRWIKIDDSRGRAATNIEFTKYSVYGVLLSLLAVVICVFYGESISILLFGEGFAPLGRLLALFAALGGLRLFGAIVGVVLSARNKQSIRAISSTIGLVVLVSLLIPWQGGYGISYVISVQMFVHFIMLSMTVYGLTRVWRGR